MSFLLIIGGIVELVLGLVICILTMFGMIPQSIVSIVILVMGVIFGLILALVGILANGVVGPAMSAKMSGKQITQVVTASKKLRWLVGKERQGMVETRIGRFIVIPNSVYTLPNDTRTGFAYFKYGTTLQPQYVKACTQLRKAGINDVDDLAKAADNAVSNGGELMIPLEDPVILPPEVLAQAETPQPEEVKGEPNNV